MNPLLSPTAVDVLIDKETGRRVAVEHIYESGLEAPIHFFRLRIKEGFEPRVEAGSVWPLADGCTRRSSQKINFFELPLTIQKAFLPEMSLDLYTYLTTLETL